MIELYYFFWYKNITHIFSRTYSTFYSSSLSTIIESSWDSAYQPSTRSLETAVSFTTLKTRYNLFINRGC